MGAPAIRVEGLGKRYRIRLWEPYRSLRETLARAASAPFRRLGAGRNGAPEADREIWALKDVSFEVQPGEVVGIIGLNGTGKSTLLKILSRITDPTEGRAEVRGRVRALLEVGTGFHPELTGRENIFLNGAILGMKRREVAAKLDEIVAFAELKKFLDTPVKRYSSGMAVRLAFAVAAHLEPEILLVDEVLAVGDAAFQRKCLSRMSEVAQGGRTVLFVSHNLPAVARLCERGILLEGGRVAYIGSAQNTIAKYQASIQTQKSEGLKNVRDRRGSGLIRIKNVSVYNPNEAAPIHAGGPICFKFELQAASRFSSTRANIGLSISDMNGDRLITLWSRFDPYFEAADTVIEDGTVVTCTVPRLMLRPGLYSLSFSVGIDYELSDLLMDAMTLDVHEADFYGTGVLPNSRQGPILSEQIWRYAQ